MTARILVVDDNAANRKLLEARLNAEYFDVLTASSGPDAIAMCERGLCDIVLLDVMMPEMDGFEVCRRLKGHIATAHLPIVMVTALDQPADRVRRERNARHLLVADDFLDARDVYAEEAAVDEKRAQLLGLRFQMISTPPSFARTLEAAFAGSLRTRDCQVRAAG